MLQLNQKRFKYDTNAFHSNDCDFWQTKRSIHVHYLFNFRRKKNISFDNIWIDCKTMSEHLRLDLNWWERIAIVWADEMKYWHTHVFIGKSIITNGLRKKMRARTKSKRKKMKKIHWYYHTFFIWWLSSSYNCILSS